MKAREFADARALLAALRSELVALLEPVAKPLAIDSAARPFVILTVGVNGVGKTTTIGKLARRYKDEGRGLMLAAGDTFRAAAVAQLQRSEEHTSELQSLMRISYAVFCLKKKKNIDNAESHTHKCILPKH